MVPGAVKKQHKCGSSEKVEDFRPVSVLLVVAKLLEQVVHRQLYAYLH